MNLQSGDRVGQYVVIHKLGQGGMSSVYRARDDEHSREVVLKFPHEDMVGDPSTYERFRREIQIGQMLTHSHIQKLYALSGDHTSPYLVLEYVNGITLRELLHREKRLSVEKAVNLAVQIAHALDYAHTHHVYHRDLKPENVIVTPEGTAKVMDFGIALVAGARRVTWGRLSAQVGTPDYMAPEQIKGNRGNACTDIYALGMILYECLAGQLPYQGDNALAIMSQHVTVSPRPLGHFLHHVNPVLEEVVMKAIRRNPDARWQSMKIFIDALEHPEQIDAVALRVEREQQETKSEGGADIGNSQFGIPLWQVVIICVSVILGLVALVVITQSIHGR